jgi:hypothetical protein
VTRFCPRPYFGDLVILTGVRGIVDREWSQYDPDGKRKGWHLVLFEDGTAKWGPPAELERLHAEFIGLPNEWNAPEPNQPLTLWQQIPHGFDSYLWSNIPWDASCMYCGLAESTEIHTNNH